MTNRLFVANKPKGVSSNNFLRDIKRRYKVKKAGYSGTLDPFACGVLIVAFGQYTKLFNYLLKTPKIYKATLQLGAYSPTLDNEQIEKITKIEPLEVSFINQTLQSLVGELEYLPPKYSAKNINGKRAYELARDGVEFELKSIKSTIYDIKLLSYAHPLLSFEISISEGGYVRSIGQIIAQRLGSIGTLVSLQRVKEGEFYFDDEKSLNPLNFLNTKKNQYLSDKSDILLGKKLNIDNLEVKEDGFYHIVIDDFLSIVSIEDKKVSYKLNKIRMQGC